MSIYELAYHLRLPVHTLLDTMPYDEFIKWMAYFDDRPVGWRDDDRAHKLMAAWGMKAKPEEVFMSLARIKEADNRRIKKEHAENELNLNNFKRSGLFSKLLGASGGDKVAFLENL
jgi:hypothetical protein